jgi:hypothetical protein
MGTPPTGMPITTLTRLLLLAISAIAFAMAGSTPALAGTFDVHTCTANSVATPPPALPGADDAWVFETNDGAHLEYAPRCPPTDDSEADGLVVQSILNSGSAPEGDFAQLRFDAPTGTSVARARLWGLARKRTNGWELYTRLADDTQLPGSDCSLAPSDLSCEVGGTGLVADSGAIDTGSVRVGIACSNLSSCSTGNLKNGAFSAIYAATVTVKDLAAPLVGGASGSVLGAGYIHGTVTAGVTLATDTTGIRTLRVVADGNRTVGESPDRAACDFSRRVPCTSITAPESFSFDSRNIGDGVHTVQVGATDSAQNFTAADTRQITVDNTAPFAPTPTSPTSMTVPAPGATISWADPGGQTAPITTAHIVVCGPAGCVGSTQPEGGGGGSATIPLTAGRGRYTASVSLEDAAGNWVPGVATTWTIDFPAPAQAMPAPAPTPSTNPPAPLPTVRTSPRLTAARPKVARDRRTIVVRGSVASGVRGRVTVSATARINSRNRTVRRTATIRNRRYSVRLRLPSARWRTALVTVRFPGDQRHRAARVTRRVTLRET